MSNKNNNRGAKAEELNRKLRLKSLEAYNNRRSFSWLKRKTCDSNTNRKKVDKKTLDLFESLFSGQDTKPNFTEVAKTYVSFIDGNTEIVNVKTGEQYDPIDFPKLSYGTVYRYLSMWKSKVGTYIL